MKSSSSSNARLQQMLQKENHNLALQIKRLNKVYEYISSPELKEKMRKNAINSGIASGIKNSITDGLKLIAKPALTTGIVAANICLWLMRPPCDIEEKKEIVEEVSRNKKKQRLPRSKL